MQFAIKNKKIKNYYIIFKIFNTYVLTYVLSLLFDSKLQITYI